MRNLTDKHGGKGHGVTEKELIAKAEKQKEAAYRKWQAVKTPRAKEAFDKARLALDVLRKGGKK
jgi:hypothetical protein